MQVRCLYFAEAKDIVGCREEIITLDQGADTAQLKKVLLALHPSLQKIIQHCIFAVNLEYESADTNTPLNNGDEVALIPPISGG